MFLLHEVEVAVLNVWQLLHPAIFSNEKSLPILSICRQQHACHILNYYSAYLTSEFSPAQKSRIRQCNLKFRGLIADGDSDSIFLLEHCIFVLYSWQMYSHFFFSSMCGISRYRSQELFPVVKKCLTHWYFLINMWVQSNLMMSMSNALSIFLIERKVESFWGSCLRFSLFSR